VNPLFAIARAWHGLLIGALAADPPDPGLARGRIPAPGWLILGLGGLVIAGAIAILVVRHRRGPRDPS
jgi:hypothetical protein